MTKEKEKWDPATLFLKSIALQILLFIHNDDNQDQEFVRIILPKKEALRFIKIVEKI